MSKLRVFGTYISGNRRLKQPLTPCARAAICSGVAAGQSLSVVADAFKVTRQTVYNTVKHYAERNTFKNLPRSRRPRILSPRKERYILQLARRFPKVL